jgi:hypothetical protein
VPYHITRSLNHIIALLRRQSPTVQAVSTARPARRCRRQCFGFSWLKQTGFSALASGLERATTSSLSASIMAHTVPALSTLFAISGLMLHALADDPVGTANVICNPNYDWVRPLCVFALSGTNGHCY